MLGKKIHDLRIKQGWTLQQLADRVGSSKGYIWELENKPNANPSAKLVYNLAVAFNTTIEYLIDPEIQWELMKPIRFSYKIIAEAEENILREIAKNYKIIRRFEPVDSFNLVRYVIVEVKKKLFFKNLWDKLKNRRFKLDLFIFQFNLLNLIFLIAMVIWCAYLYSHHIDVLTNKTAEDVITIPAHSPVFRSTTKNHQKSIDN